MPPPRTVRVFLVLLVMILSWQVLSYLASMIFPATETVGTGTIEISRRVEGVFVRSERIIVSPGAGSFQRLHKEGKRIARFGEIGTIKDRAGRVTSVSAPASGLVCYTFDGRERTLDPGIAPADPEGAFQAAQSARMRAMARGIVAPGQALARLVDDREQYVITRLAGEKPPAAGQNVWIRGPEGELVPFTVAGVTPDGADAWIVLRTERFPGAWLAERRAVLDLILERHTGMLVPLRCLRRRDGVQGVMLVQRGRARFTPVTVIAQDGRRAVVRGLPADAILRTR